MSTDYRKSLTFKDGFVPFPVPEIAEDGFPFSEWDTTTLYRDDILDGGLVGGVYTPGSYRMLPSKSDSSLVRVYGEGTQYCIKLTLDQLCELWWRAKWIKATMSPDGCPVVSTVSVSASGGVYDDSGTPTTDSSISWANVSPSIMTESGTPGTDPSNSATGVAGTGEVALEFRRDGRASFIMGVMQPVDAVLSSEVDLVCFPPTFQPTLFFNDWGSCFAGSGDSLSDPSTNEYASSGLLFFNIPNDPPGPGDGVGGGGYLFSPHDANVVGGQVFAQCILSPIVISDSTVNNIPFFLPTPDNVIKVGPNEYWFAPLASNVPQVNTGLSGASNTRGAGWGYYYFIIANGSASSATYFTPAEVPPGGRYFGAGSMAVSSSTLTLNSDPTFSYIGHGGSPAPTGPPLSWGGFIPISITLSSGVLTATAWGIKSADSSGHTYYTDATGNVTDTPVSGGSVSIAGDSAITDVSSVVVPTVVVTLPKYFTWGGFYNETTGLQV